MKSQNLKLTLKKHTITKLNEDLAQRNVGKSARDCQSVNGGDSCSMF